MAKKKAAKKTPSADRRLANIERLVRAGFQQVDRRFTQVDRRFAQVERHLSQVDRRLDQVDHRFEQIDRHFEQIDKRLDQVDQRFDQIDRRFGQIDRRLDQVDQRFAQIDRRLDLLELGQRDLRAEMNEKFALIEERINVLANHVDGFIKLHETLDIEFKVIKEQMTRLEARLDRLEAERRS